MGRWEPDAAGRLRTAAMALYAEQGFERTTVAEIADRAGVTARTFFRYYADKREVLFAGSEELEAHMVAALDAAPASAPPLQAVSAAVLAATEVLTDREFSRRRQAVIAATPELRERELSKLASLASSFAAALRRRGVTPGVAELAAETGVAVFRVAWERWVAESEPDLEHEPAHEVEDPGAAGAELADVVRATFADLAGLTRRPATRGATTPKRITRE